MYTKYHVKNAIWYTLDNQTGEWEHVWKSTKMQSKQQSTSALVQHIQATEHNIDFESTKIIASEECYKIRTAREAFEIEKTENLNRRNDSVRLPNTWKPIIPKKKSSEGKHHITNLSADIKHSED